LHDVREKTDYRNRGNLSRPGFHHLVLHQLLTMRSEQEVQDFKSRAQLEVYNCKRCQGKDPSCACFSRMAFRVSCFEACIPRDFWGVLPTDISHNREVFDNVVRPYCDNMVKARLRGYGLLLLGDNGVGKSMFISYILTRTLSHGFTAYYTTLPRLDFDIKRGFNNPEHAERLQWMLTSDFLAIDEMGKEQFRTGDSYIKTQVERILKERFDESLPTLIATNAALDSIEEIYGTTLTSILLGKYQTVTMVPGDFRAELRKRMVKEMGYTENEEEVPF
jgi:hypothetical protein